MLFLFSMLASVAHLAAAPQLVTVAGPSSPTHAGGSGDSGLSVISPDGRFVLFASMANNLTPTNNYNLAPPFRLNVFLRDRLNQTTRLVSVNEAGVGGNGDSFPTGISTNGRFALFESAASDLVANDTNNAGDVFVRDLVNGTTTLVSVGPDSSSASGGSHGSVLTPDGRYVAFVSTASNLVSGDTNGLPDVFVRDLQAGLTTLVSVGAQATNPVSLGSSSESPEITPDGRYVVFCSSATNLLANVITPNEIYVRDLVAGQTSWASTNARALAQAVLGNPNIVCCNYSISDDGQFVAFEACSNAPPGSGVPGLILRYSLQSGLTDVIYTNANVPILPFESRHNLSMSPDGRFVAFVAGTSLVTNAIFLWDADTGTDALVSVSLDKVTPASGFCDLPVLSANGRFVAFSGSANNLVTNPLTGNFHLYVRDMQADSTQLLDTDTNGVGAGVDSTVAPALSANGSFAAFDSPGLLPDNRHLIRDVFVHALATGVNELVSASDPTLSSQAPNGSSGFTSCSVSSNGQFVAFYSDADNLVPNDTNGCRDVFVRDLIAGTNILASANTNGHSGDRLSTEPSISGDGRQVVFMSWADDLVDNDTNQAEDVFVRDLQAGTTLLVSVSTNGVSPGNGNSYSPTISADGRYVLFHSLASNLAGGQSGNGSENLFFRDLQTGTTYVLTAQNPNSSEIAAVMTPDGQNVAFIGIPPDVRRTGLYVWNAQRGALIYTNIVANLPGAMVAISPDGQRLAYASGSYSNLFAADLLAGTVVSLNPDGAAWSDPGFRFSGDGRRLTYVSGSTTVRTQNIYLYDFELGTNELISQNYNFNGPANTNSDSPAISADGRFIAYRSSATNLVPFDATSVAELFVYDSSNAATILVSVNAAGQPAADRSLRPVFSGDSRWLFLQSWAPDISSHDFNNASDVFALDLSALPLIGANGGGSTNATAFPVQFFPGGIYNSSPTLAWPLAAGRIYQVQFTTNLTDAVWQNLTGDLNISGGTGYVSDPAPMTTGQRFYRIVSRP